MFWVFLINDDSADLPSANATAVWRKTPTEELLHNHPSSAILFASIISCEGEDLYEKL